MTKAIAYTTALLLLMGGGARAETVTVPPAGEARSAFGTWGVDLGARDTSIRPGDSFFDHAVGSWTRTAVIPADRPAIGTMIELRMNAESQLRAIIEESTRASGDAQMAKIGALYAAYMDEAQLEALDAKPLGPDLARIRALRDKDALARLMGASHGGFGGRYFSLGVGPDRKDPTDNVLYVRQSGLGLPNRDYYLKDSFARQRAAYLAYVARTLRMLGWADADAAAKAVLAMETRIAEGSWSRIQQRDAVARYNPMTLAELQAHAPQFPWQAFLSGAGLEGADRLVVSEKSAFPPIAAVYAETPLDTLKAWAAFHLASDAAGLLSKRFVDSQFAFEKEMSGTTELPPRWRRGVGFVNGVVGELVGQQYVKRHFPPASKTAMEAMVANLKLAMRGRIERLDWMSAATKREALAKLDAMRVMVGYPDKWRDYSSLRVDAADLFGNALRAAAFEWRWEVGKLDKPVDPHEWGMTPQTVNAYADGSRNVIVFPAAILQPPFFSLTADPAVNYGAIGGVIGHEITHLFDDQGRRVDARGVLRDWWTPADAERFTAEAQKLGAQYDSYEVAPGARVQGGLTMGENIADLGGILLGLEAYRASLDGRPAPVIDGLTGEQRVFMGWAQVWRVKQREEAARQQVASDAHSPPRFRVDGPLRNIDAWYQAFGVGEKDRLYLPPDQRVRIW